MVFLRRARFASAPLVMLCGSLLPACSDDASPIDAGAPDAGTLDADVHGGLRLPRCEDTEPLGSTDVPQVASTLVSTLAPVAPRLAMPGDLNPATEEGESLYRMMGFDALSIGPAQERVLRMDLGGVAPPAAGRRSIAWIAHLSDFQLVDDESPVRLAGYDSAAIPGGLRAQEAYLPRAVSAMSRTFARVERPERPYDFAIITGDCADSAQKNELAWVVQLMNGTPALHTDSGLDDDPVPGPDNDPKDPFDPVAVPAPWLYVPGNHDVEVVGITAIDDAQRAAATGTRASSGTRDYERWYAPVARGAVPRDPERALVDRAEIVATLLADTSAEPGPPGHGYTGTPDTSIGANYAYDAIPGLLRVIALDTSDETGGSPGLVLPATVAGFLRPELDRARADGVLVMIASHHATTAMDDREGEAGAAIPEAVAPTALEQLVASYENVIVWLVGHDHDARVRAVAGADAAHPGYWEIMTPAIADWPSQSRFLELVDNGNGTLSIFATLVDFDTETCMERRFRRLVTTEFVSGWEPRTSTAPENQNVELVLPLPAVAAAAVAGAMAGDRIESETTLRAP
jgi:hypothetical protein